MPCRSDYYDDGSAARAMAKQISELEEMLCADSRVLERQGFDFDENPQPSKWWYKHKKADAEKQARIELENGRKNVALELSKQPWTSLSKAERQLVLEYFS